MPAVTGLRGTGDWGPDERPKNFREMILWLNPNGDAPLQALMSKMRKESTDDPEFSWWEETNVVWRGAINNGAGYTATDTTLTIDTADALELKKGDLLLVETAEDTAYSAEIMEIASDPTSSTSITVTRGVAGSTAAALPDNTFLTKIGSANEEGSRAPTATSRNPTKQFNYTEIQKDSYSITGTAEVTKARTGDPVKNDKKRKMFDHFAALEFTSIFGKRFETTGANGKPKRYSGGLMYFLADAATNRGITSAMKIWSAAATEDTFIDTIAPMFDYRTDDGNVDTRIVLCGNGFLTNLNKLVRNSSSTRIQYDGEIKFYGLSLRQFTIPQGTLYLKTHPLFNQHGRYTNSAIFINPSAIRWRYMNGRDTKFKDNVQLPDEDARRGYWLTEGGVEVNYARTMQYQGNFQI